MISELEIYARQVAAKYGIDPEVFARLVAQESGWDPTAQSGAGAMGLTQLMPGTARDMGVTDPWDPYQNLEGGAKYLGIQLQAFGGDYGLALAAYNAGPGNVMTPNGPRIPDFAETQNYVRTILSGYTTQATGGPAMPGPTTTPGAPTENPLGTSIGAQLSAMLTAAIGKGPPAATGDEALDALNFNRWTQGISYLSGVFQSVQGEAAGFFTLPDGQVVAKGSLSPQQQQALTTSNYNAYAKLMNDVGLQQYTLGIAAMQAANSASTQQYQNTIAGVQASLGVDAAGLSRSRQVLDQWIAAQSVASADQEAVAKAQEQVGKYGTDGRTEFSAADLGEANVGFAHLLGQDPNAPVLRYPGTITHDPIGDRQRALAGMGVSAIPPSIPAPQTTASMIPTAPSLITGFPTGPASPMPYAPPVGGTAPAGSSPGASAGAVPPPTGFVDFPAGDYPTR